MTPRIAIFGNLCGLGAVLQRAMPEAILLELDWRFEHPGHTSMPRLLYELMRADVAVSLAGTLSARRLWPFLRSGTKLVAYATGSDLREADGRMARYFQRADLVIVTQFDRLTRKKITQLQLNPYYMPNPTYVAPSAKPAVFQGLYPYKFTVYLAAANDERLKGRSIALDGIRQFMIHHEDVGLRIRDGVSYPPREINVGTMLPTAYWALAAACDVVVDQFAIGAAGLTSIEAAMLGVPVITKLDHGIDKFYSRMCPFLRANTAHDIAASLKWLYEIGPVGRKQFGDRGREWALSQHGLDRADEVAQLVRRMVAKRRAA